ncbi:sirohydrochlorin chelatase [Corynebacterium massiliense]|uniref:Sirohydrochlorin cobaltochelatase n=1 Tax=Corynebacterium massiliense DSM 45435 TaxID=1121364 RepID=A0ABY7U5L8_9CORY|nr:sirohydrochlorin chelatase [Corynebacterium massiliense]WCZ31986.1 Sirohydrochlorin cobaltochelatase [Corynebacterium massiliense DSM 45435]
MSLAHLARPSLLTLSHGSRHPAAARGIEALTQTAAQAQGFGSGDFAAAHLEFNEPTLGDAAIALAERGHRAAIVVPLLFSNGYHQRVDVPAELDAAHAASGLTLLRAPGLGLGADVEECLARHVRRSAYTDSGQRLRVVVYAVGSATPGANEAVGEFAQRVGRRLGVPATAAFATRGGVKAVFDAARACQPGERVVVIPLFVTAGLLLDRLSQAVREGGDAEAGDTVHDRIVVLPPLREALADVVAQRYADTAAALATTPSAAMPTSERQG